MHSQHEQIIQFNFKSIQSMRLTSKLVKQKDTADYFNVSEKTSQRWRNNQMLKTDIQ
tara:strand:+ start:704 stop:874 length:171 start_codon:yes stop_codon:yes gene_type:complete